MRKTAGTGRCRGGCGCAASDAVPGDVGAFGGLAVRLSDPAWDPAWAPLKRAAPSDRRSVLRRRRTARISVLTAPVWRGRGPARLTASATAARVLAAGLLRQWRARVPESRRGRRRPGFPGAGRAAGYRAPMATAAHEAGTAPGAPRRGRPGRLEGFRWPRDRSVAGRIVLSNERPGQARPVGRFRRCGGGVQGWARSRGACVLSTGHSPAADGTAINAPKARTAKVRVMRSMNSPWCRRCPPPPAPGAARKVGPALPRRLSRRCRI